MLARGMDTCSEMDEKGGLSLSAAEQDIGHNSRHRDTIESTTTCGREARTSHRICLHSAAESQRKQDHRDPKMTFDSSPDARRRTCSSLSAALASSPARVSSRCLTGPSTDSTWASSHREGYSWHARKNRAEMSNSCTLTGQRDPGPGGGLTALESRASLRICLAVRTSSSSSQLFRVHTCCCTRTHRRSITWTRGKRR